MRGGRKHSWRVLLLPLLGCANQFEAYRFDEDWNSLHNQTVTAIMPDVFRSRNSDPDSTQSAWYLVYGESAVFSLEGERKLNDITDGAQNTIMAVEARRESHWAEPVDFQLDSKITNKLGGYEEGGFHALFADGKSHFLSNALAHEIVFSLMTANGGETISASEWRDKSK